MTPSVKQPPDDPEAIFARFVQNANAHAADPVTQRSAAPSPPSEVVTDRVVLLTKRKKVAVDLSADDTQETPPLTDEAARRVIQTLDTAKTTAKLGRMVSLRDSEPVNAQSDETEAAQVVPDVARISRPPEPVPEGSEDGQMPAAELERQIYDMQVLLRYGHENEVRQRLEELVRRYPEDLLLLRRIAELHLENDERAAAIEMLFLLAGRLFERRNVSGMRQALEQVLVLDPTHRRAYKLLGLLEQRPDTGTG
jgi:hypothetical protein